MEANPRPFERVKIGFTGVESARTRFLTDPTIRIPAVATWRVNLTALSQRHNLYFLATLDKIQVYRPSFPFQTLGRQPCLTIVPHLANQFAEGYIDEQNPHAINHLVIGDLGNQEILLFATDSGNIVAYYTSAIDAVVKRDAYKLSIDGNADFVGLRPFFSEWVNESAWGLAIHAEGRMIAVSANTPFHVANDDPTSKITVFAFALTAPSRDSDEDYSDKENEPACTDEVAEWKTWVASTPEIDGTTSDTPRRDCNYKITLAGGDGHKNNIPCVSFINAPDDCNGVWLYSTDTENQMKMWQIWKGKCSKTWKLSPRNNTAIPWTRPEDVGWFVAPLDINTFRPAKAMDEFIGHSRAPQYYGYHSAGDSYDLTNPVRDFTPQNNSIHPIDGQVEADTSEEEEDVLVADADISDNGVDDVPQPQLPTNMPAPALLTDHIEPQLLADAARANDQIIHETAADSANDESDGESDNIHEELITEQRLDTTMEFGGNDSLSDDDEDDAYDEDDDFDDDDDDDDEVDGDSIDANEDDNSPDSSENATSSTSYNPPQSDEEETRQTEHALLTSQALTALHHTLYKQPEFAVKSNISTSSPGTGDRAQAPRVPIIHCSTSHVRLYKDSAADYPHMFCARMLWQKLPPGLDTPRIASLRRLSMVQQIPELGIVIIASQLGRCAVCSLTRRISDDLPGFRVDWILPTKRQERAKVRPASCPLLGIATSPIQGHAAKQSEPPVDHNASVGRTRGHLDAGIPTTFDANVVLLNPRPQNQTYPSQQSRSRLPTTQQRLWQGSYHEEPWRAYENSRRYRLMLTYTDQTVLTYELSRNVERGDTGSLFLSAIE